MKEFVVKSALAVGAIFAPIQGMIVACLVLTAADMVLGTYAAYKRGEKITSAGFRRSVSKIFIYEIALCLGYVAQHYMLHNTVPIASIVAGFIGLTEIKSCLENLNSISGNDLLKKAIEKVGSSNQ